MSDNQRPGCTATTRRPVPPTPSSPRSPGCAGGSGSTASSGWPRGLAGLLSAQARLATSRGEDEHSLAPADEAFELVRQLGAVEDMADLLCMRAEGMTRAGDFAQARRGMTLGRMVRA
jgi:hypothetical protein